MGDDEKARHYRIQEDMTMHNISLDIYLLLPENNEETTIHVKCVNGKLNNKDVMG